MRIGSLCSGIGGLDIAVEQHYGATLAWCADNDPHAVTVMRRHWPDAPNLGDITHTDWGRVQPVDIITAGYPCQPFSQAGKRRGTDDERHLWPYIRDAIDTLRPGVVVLENVRGHLSLGGPEVVRSLAGMGYSVRWGIVRASDAGAAHRRARWFCTATTDTGSQTGGQRPRLRESQPQAVGWRRPDDSNSPASALALLPTPRATDGAKGSPNQVNGRGVRDSLPGVVALLPTPTSRDHKGRNQRNDATCLPVAVLDFGKYAQAVARWEPLMGRPAPPPTEPGRNKGRNLSPLFVEWLMGAPEGHVTSTERGDIGQADIFGGWHSDNGIPAPEQLRLLGNAVVPQAAALALSLLDGSA